MKTKLLIPSVLLSTICFAQTPADSTVARNQELIEQLKSRINTIDNIGNGNNSYQKQINELRAEARKQNDSITKLLTIINELKKNTSTNNVTHQTTQQTLPDSSANESVVYSKSLNGYDNHTLNTSEVAFQEYINSCHCSTILYEPYQVELNFKSIAMLNNILKKFEINPTQKIVLIGHADKSGKEETNMSLSKQRVEKLKSYLIKASDKIKEEDISIEWHGSTKPIPNITESKKELNRRTEILVN